MKRQEDMGKKALQHYSMFRKSNCHLTAAYRYHHSGFIPNLLMRSQLPTQQG
jgi:hypothetical protein